MSRITHVVLMVLAVLSLFLAAGCLPFVTISPVEAPPPADSSEIPPVVEEAWEIIFRDYVERDDLDADTLSQGAIRGMIEALDDPYTSYLDPEMYQLSLSDIQGKFEGIGAHVAARDEQIVIIAPIPDSPADKAGIRAGDVMA